MPARKRPTPASRSAAPVDAGRIVDAALDLAAARTWPSLSLGEIAAAAGIPLAELHRHFRSKAAILAAFVDRIDAKVLAGIDPASGAEPVRDRLMDAVLRRLDALKPYKPALRAMAGCAPDPASAVCGAARLMRSMAWTLEAAGIPSGGLAGCVRVQGLAMIYASTVRVWLDDDSEDGARTMAHLDRRLQQAERMIGRLPRAFRPRPRPPEAAPA